MDLSETGSECSAKQNTEHRRVRMMPSKYQEIAYDMAAKIADGCYRIGERFYAKSAISTQYGVSSETARRALNILSDLGIVRIVKGSGVTIVSSEKAADYIRQFQQVTSIVELRGELYREIQIQRESRERMDDILKEIKEKIAKFHQANPIAPYWVQIGDDCPLLGKTLRDLNFWNNTLATVVAVRRDGELLLSPGPYAALKAGDILYYIGDENCIQRVETLLKSAQ